MPANKAQSAVADSRVFRIVFGLLVNPYGRFPIEAAHDARLKLT
jgi:hypothetical protein